MSNPHQGADAHAQPRVKCLLVDDLKENLVALSALLQRDDVELLQAGSGIEALELLLAHDVALAFIDVQMPDMDGFELAELIRGSERTRHVPLIFVTAGARDEYRLFKGYETGAVDFLYKPIDPHILKNKAEVFFQLYRQKQQLALDLQERTETLRLNEMFVAVLGHDLRNPLSTMLMAGNLIKRVYPDETGQKVATQLLSSGKRMTKLIEDMLDLARARLAGGIPLAKKAGNLGMSAQDVVQEYRTTSGRAIELVLQGDLNGEWDSDRLSQVVANLLGNALQHGAPGEAVIVAVNGDADESVTLSVTNAGAIPEDVLPHIFDPFRGGQREPGRKEGLGLGLYIVEQVAAAHGGTITVESRSEANQTCIRVTIPRL